MHLGLQYAYAYSVQGRPATQGARGALSKMALVVAQDEVLRPTVQDVLDRLHGRSTASDGKFACLLCAERFDGLADLHSHQSYHQKTQGKRSGQRIACPECGDTFDRMQVLQRHYLRKHVDDKLFKCEKCGSGFKVVMQWNPWPCGLVNATQARLIRLCARHSCRRRPTATTTLLRASKARMLAKFSAAQSAGAANALPEQCVTPQHA